MEENIFVESGDQINSYINTLAQQPPVNDASFHGLVDGRVESLVHPNYGPDAPFWGTSMGQAIASFGVCRPPPEHSSPSEEEYRQIQSAIRLA